jgi:hypothetical protein
LPAQRDDAFRQIRKKYPAEFSAIVKEMESSPRDAMRKMMELARKSGVNLGVGRRGGNMRTPGGERNAAPELARRFDRPDMGKLRQKYPEQMKKYYELRGENPDAARKKLLEIIELERKSQK